MIGKFGLDGSGGHTIRHQSIDLDKVSEETPHMDPTAAKTSLLLVCWCPISIFQGDVGRHRRNLYRTAQHMPDQLLLFTPKKRGVEVPGWTPFLREYQGEAVVDGHDVNVLHNTNWYMIDGKMVGLPQGDSRAFRHLCTTSRQTANETTLIEEGFTIKKELP